MRTIRKAVSNDTPAILSVMEAARGIMRSSGNLHQWGEGYPSAEAIDSDRMRGGGFVIEDDGRIVLADEDGRQRMYTLQEVQFII